jgi:hypothetical protein
MKNRSRGLFDEQFRLDKISSQSDPLVKLLFRDTMSGVGEIRTAQENKGDKMHLLYEYLTSLEFRQKIEAIVEAFQQMQEDLNKEKSQTLSHWAKREKQIYKVMEIRSPCMATSAASQALW